MQEIRYHRRAWEALAAFPQGVKRELAEALRLLQMGRSLGMPLSRPMPSVANGVHELRLRDASGIFRVFYYAKLMDRILVFHAFGKKSRKTPSHEIDLAWKRLREMLSNEKG